jgi:3-methyladenine DNA glycosylase AlkD
MKDSISRGYILEIVDKAIINLSNNNLDAFFDSFRPLLEKKCPFSKLDLIGKTLGLHLKKKPELLIKGFDMLIESNKMGSYVIVSQGLFQLMPENLDLIMEKSRQYIIYGDKWYVCDIFGERSIGMSLVNHFDITLPWIEKYLQDENKWIRRSAGVSIHFFSKRILDQKERTIILLNILEPHIEEKQIDIVKGIGWGLKTIGKYHPDILTEFLISQSSKDKNISKTMLRKALTYLPKDKRMEIGSFV